MRVNCPQCGREFDVPESESNRLLRCMCKNLFRAADSLKENKNEPSEPKQIVLETRQGLYSDDENISSSEIESSLSGEEIEGFLTNLKKGREEIGQAEVATKPIVKTVNVQPKEIELGESKAERKESKVPKAEDIVPELLNPESTADIPLAKPTAQNAQKVVRPMAPPTYKPSVWEQFQDLSVTKQIGALALAALPIVIVGISMVEREAPPPPPDETIAKLLTPAPAPAPAPTPAPAPAPTPIPKQAAPTPPAIKPTNDVRAETKDERPYASLYQNSIEGNFENVIRIGAAKMASLSKEEKALFYEAQLARAGRDASRISEIRDAIQKSNQGRDSDPALRRALLTSYLRDPNAKQGIAKVAENFQQLVVTRSRDPILFAYLGMTYEKLDRPDLAHQAWDQALMLEPHLIWVIERREQFYRNMKDYKKAMTMAARLTKISGFQAEGFTKMAELAKLVGDAKASADYYRQALKFKDDVNTRLVLAQQLTESSKDPTRDLEAALTKAKDKKTRAKIFTQLGRNHCRDSKIEQGLRYLKQATKEAPDFALAYYERGLCERSAGNSKRSASSFAAALKYERGDHRIWLQYALSLDQDGKTKAAFSALQQSLNLKATDTGHLAMAQMLLKTKKQQEALIHAKKAFALNPQNQKARLMVSELEK